MSLVLTVLFKNDSFSWKVWTEGACKYGVQSWLLPRGTVYIYAHNLATMFNTVVSLTLSAPFKTIENVLKSLNTLYIFLLIVACVSYAYS